MRLTVKEMLDRASTLAVRAHEGHVRKDGSPYIAHPLRVAMNVSNNQARVIALLHDVVEDTPITLEQLREDGFSESIVSAVDALTRRRGETYRDFISRVLEGSTDAIAVKIADIRDNLADQSALDPDEAKFLKERYELALRRLMMND